MGHDGGTCPEGSSIGTALASLGLSEKRTKFIETQLHPLMTKMVGEAVSSLPLDPAVFCLKWLMQHLAVPDLVAQPLLEWADKRPDAARVAQPLKTGDSNVEHSESCEPMVKTVQVKSPSLSDELCPGSDPDLGVQDSPISEQKPGAVATEPMQATQRKKARPKSAAMVRVDVAASKETKKTKRRPSSAHTVNFDEGQQRSILKKVGYHKSCDVLPSMKDEPLKSILRQPSPPEKEEDSVQPRKSSLRKSKDCEDGFLSGAAEASLPPRRLSRQGAAIQATTDIIEDALMKVPNFRKLDQQERSTLAQRCVIKQFDPCSEVVHYGDMTGEILVVLEGSMRVSVPRLVNTLQQGDWVGESVLLKGETTAEWNLAASPDRDLTILSVDVRDLESLGLRKKNQRTRKGRNATRYIARPELRSQNSSIDVVSHKDVESGSVNCRGRLTTEVPQCLGEVESYEKSDEDLDFIKLAIGRNQYITDTLQLSEEQVTEIASCMELVRFPSEALVIKRGDSGDKFYVIQTGRLEVVLTPEPDDPSKAVPGSQKILLHPGDSFGELSMLYDSPRKASIVARRNCSLWVLGMTQWRSVVRRRAANRIDEYASLLRGIPDLSLKVPHEAVFRKLADSLEEVSYSKDMEVVTEGMQGQSLYIVFDGSVRAHMVGKEVGTLNKGDYFGEEMMFTATTYPCTVTVISESATFLTLDSSTVKAVEKLKVPTDSTDSSSGQVQPPELHQMRRRKSLMTMALGTSLSAQSPRISQNKLEYPLDSFQRVGVLGFGSFAMVTLEEHPASGRLFALKAMSKTHIVKNGLKNMVLGERRALVDVESPFVTCLQATFQDDRTIYFLLEPAMGGELFSLYSENEDWFGSEPHATFFVTCVALGLEHIHQHRIIHRDVKLENILLDSNGYAQITDLGLAKHVVGKTYTVCGSADYLAPETLKQVGHNRAVDWWALGILTFCIMAGRMPFEDEDVMQIYKNIVKGFRKEMFPKSFSEHLTDFIKNLCRKKPQERMTMLPGGVQNLATHPWLVNAGRDDKWKDISSKTFSDVPYVPTRRTTEEWRSVLKQECEENSFEDYVDDGTGWDDPF